MVAVVVNPALRGLPQVPKRWIVELTPAPGLSGAYLRRIRKARKMQPAEVADELGINRSNMSSYEGGRVVPPQDVRALLILHYAMDEDEVEELERRVNIDYRRMADNRGKRDEPLEGPAVAIGPPSPQLRLLMDSIAARELEERDLERIAKFVDETYPERDRA